MQHHSMYFLRATDVESETLRNSLAQVQTYISGEALPPRLQVR